MGSNYGVLLARLASRNEVLLLYSMVITLTAAQERNLQPLPRSNRRDPRDFRAGFCRMIFLDRSSLLQAQLTLPTKPEAHETL
jgi:hypothetical protein